MYQHGREEKCMCTKPWSKNLKGRSNLEDMELDGKGTIKMDLKEIGWENVDWIHAVQDRNQWRALVNNIMNDVSFSQRWL
jgi:hypothetical protein